MDRLRRSEGVGGEVLSKSLLIQLEWPSKNKARISQSNLPGIFIAAYEIVSNPPEGNNKLYVNSRQKEP